MDSNGLFPFITTVSAKLHYVELYSPLTMDTQDRSSVTPSASNMKPIEWDEGLATAAQQLADSCKFEHNRAGQNLYEGSDPADLVKQAIDAWHNEHKDYNYDSNTCGPNAICGHYTQVSDIHHKIHCMALEVAYESFTTRLFGRILPKSVWLYPRGSVKVACIL